MELGRAQEHAPVKKGAEKQRLVEEDGMMFGVHGEKEGFLSRRKVVQTVVKGLSAPLRFDAMIEEVVMAFKGNALKGEGQMTGVFAVYADAVRLEECGNLRCVVTRKQVVVATFAMEGLRIVIGQRGAFDDDDGQIQAPPHIVRKFKQNVMPQFVVMFY